MGRGGGRGDGEAGGVLLSLLVFLFVCLFVCFLVFVESSFDPLPSYPFLSGDGGWLGVGGWVGAGGGGGLEGGGGRGRCLSVLTCFFLFFFSCLCGSFCFLSLTNTVKVKSSGKIRKGVIVNKSSSLL